ncbi:MAG: hypothetical protein M3198_00530 [Actinomycetota bacterium]|nr:hypothetical protein [Actinomycetota bacterium]
MWACGFVLVGFLADESWHLVEKWAGRTGMLVLTVVIFIGIGVALRKRRIAPARRDEDLDEMPDSRSGKTSDVL